MSASSQQAIRKLLQTPKLRLGIQQVRADVFANAPILGIRTGRQGTKTQLKGVYYTQYYLDNIERSARKVMPGYKSEYEERKFNKMNLLKRTGRGRPKKGAGARAQKRK